LTRRTRSKQWGEQGTTEEAPASSTCGERRRSTLVGLPRESRSPRRGQGSVRAHRETDGEVEEAGGAWGWLESTSERGGRRVCRGRKRRVQGLPARFLEQEIELENDAKLVVPSAWRGVDWNSGATSTMARGCSGISMLVSFRAREERERKNSRAEEGLSGGEHSF
jgi:hypothetical protein